MTTLEQLRKEARSLESEIDTKLTSFSKFGTSHAQSDMLREEDQSDSSSASLLSGDNVSSAMGMEIEQLLLRLSEVNDSMSKSADNTPSANNYITNHRTKLHEYTQDFKRIKNQIRTAREHAQLLLSVRQDISQYKNSQSTRQDNLLRERGSLHSSERMVDNLIGQAIDARDNLNAQRNFIENSLFKVRNISRAFPGISRAMNTISRKKKRDLIIVAAFIAFCMSLLLLYLFGRG
eukprot:Phypoly_transcript_13949.p1 GENE.Phypoly_transcript_13949~~Phypoly_transcript_13949.p1  ORF type:complete len:235 (+),score=14.80 Phypoly_transcript_13949:145-849(+)